MRRARAGLLRVALSLLAGGALLLPAAGGAAESGDRAAELDELRDAIRESRERVVSREAEERALLDEIDAMDREADRLRHAVRAARSRASSARAAREHAEREADTAARRFARSRDAMRTRMVALYKSGTVGPVRVLFSAGSLQDLVARVSILSRLVDRDADLVRRFRDARDRALATRERAAEAASESEAAEAELQSRTAALEATRRQRARLLASVRRERSRERVLLIELERAARALEATLQSLGDEAPPETVLDPERFASLRGRLDPPVDAQLVQRFGRRVDPEFGTETFHKGVAFGAGAGEPVHPVATGVVRFAGWFRGYGRIAILDHGGGHFSVSGHLDELFVEVGDRVEQEDVLGTVGETGSLSGPRLYFEIRAGRDPVDPVEWLDLGSRG